MTYDKIIIGAGIYGLYAALLFGKIGKNVLVLEYENEPFSRATYINQARVHMGYHYPRSISTAIKSARYFERFCRDFNFCIHNEFDQVYATSSEFSWSNAEQFKCFCKNADILCDEIPSNNYFNKNICDGSFLTKEYTYDAQMLKKYLLEEIAKFSNIYVRYQSDIKTILKEKFHFKLIMENTEKFESDFILNATYGSVNQILNKAGFEQFEIKYELCEIILCNVSEKLKNVGITVMDGPFFSIMPFGKTGFHSLTSVTFTPHVTSYEKLPKFDCQDKSAGFCSTEQLGNCNNCAVKPESAWPYMSNLAKKYLKEEYKFSYVKSLYSIKPILKSSEIDDSRPTVIRQFSESPTFISVLSGKINTIYDLEEVLLNDYK